MLQDDVLAMEYPSPGLLIRQRLQQRGWNQRTLATVLNIREPALTQILTDRQSITAELALAFEDVLGTPAETLLMLQARLNLARARSAHGKGVGAGRKLFSEFPVAEMMQRGWLPGASGVDHSTAERALLKFFAADDLASLDLSRLSGLAPSDRVPGLTDCDLVWLFHARRVAERIDAPAYRAVDVETVLDALKPCRANLEAIAQVPAVLEGCGIRFLLVERLGASLSDGASFRMSDGGMAIAMTMRVDRISHFWFVLSYLLARLRGEHCSNVVAIDLDSDSASEGLANRQDAASLAVASEFCTPAYSLAEFLARHSRFSERNLRDFSRAMGLHPGLVARAIERTVGKHTRRLRNHQSPVRHILTPHAASDGWALAFSRPADERLCQPRKVREPHIVPATTSLVREVIAGNPSALL